MAVNYVERQELLDELILLKETDIVSENLHLLFFKIAKNYSTINSFRNYTYIEDMISDAYINCVVMARKFDISFDKLEGSDKPKALPNPFAYFTTVIHRNFLNHIAKEKKQMEKKFIELKKTVELYKIENDIDMPLPKGLSDKINGYV